jgi:hypothetical protein
MRRNFIALVVLSFFLCGKSEGATLSGYFVSREPGSNIDLTTVGDIDWIHWGLDGTNATRKWSGAVIGESLVIGTNSALQVTNNVQFGWSDGFPAGFATNVFTTSAMNGETNGFSVLIQGSSDIRKLRIYAGAYAVKGQLEVIIDDGATPAYVDTSLDSLGETNGYYFLDLQSDQNNNDVTVNFTATAVYDTNGYLSLHAIALTTNTAPTAFLTAVTNEQNVITGVPTLVTATASDFDGTITNVSFFLDGDIKIGEATTAPYEVLWTATDVGPHSITAVATDSNGGQGTSAAVSFYVTGTNGAVLTSLDVAPASVNLTEEGTSDWVHWGVYTDSSVDRKTGVAPQIGDLVPTSQAYPFWDNPTTFTWTDGVPNLSMTATPTGVYIPGLYQGFQLTLPADTNPRTLKLYVGSFGARGKFTAILSDYSAPVFIDRSIENFGNGPASVYTLNYAAASPAQTLNITFSVDQVYDGFGNVTVQAATLVSSANPLYVALTGPTNNTVFSSPASIPLQAILTGGDGAPRPVEFYNGAVKIGVASNAPYAMNWNVVTPGVYTLYAKATNSLGIVQTSDPVRVFVVSNGGFLDGGFSTSSGSVDLTAEGTRDWVHWGLERKGSLNRKLNVLPLISDFDEIGSGQVNQYTDNPVSFSWSDGGPNLTIGGTTTGVYVNELGSGFEITVPADKTLRRLEVYVGLYGARGELEAWLSDYSAPPFINASLESVYNNPTAVYTIDYSAPTVGKTLTVRYTSKMLFDEEWGNVTLQAATLKNLAPVVGSVQVSPIGAGFNVPTEIGWNYFIDYTDTLFPPNWLPLTSFGGSGAPISVSDPTFSPTNRFYRVRISK